MSETASAYVSLIPSFRGGARGIADALGGGGAVDKAGESIGTRLGGGLGRALKRSAVGVGAIVAGVLGTALVKGFGRLTAIENATAKLTGLGNSAKSVTVIMDNALASVKGTAFGLDEAATVSAGAVAAGVKPGKELTKTLKLVADAATIGGSSLGEMGAIFNKVASSNKIQGDTINQLNDQGIPIVQLLAKTMHKTSAEVVTLASEGKIGFAQFSTAMQSGLGGAALKSGQTTQGAFKNMGAALGRFGAVLLGGVFPLARVAFGGITTFLDNLTAKVKPFVAAVNGGLIGTVIPALRNAAGVVKTFWQGFTAPVLFVNSANTVKKFGADVASHLIVARRAATVFWFGLTRPADVTGKSPAMAKWGAEVGTVLNTARASATEFWIGFTDPGAVTSTNSAIAQFGAQANATFATARTSLANLFASVKPQVMANVSSIMATLGETVKTLKPFLDQLWAQFGPAVSAMLPGLLQLAQLLNPVSLIVHALLPVLPSLAEAFGKIAVALTSAILPVLPALISGLNAVVSVLSSGLQSTLVTLLPMVADLATFLAPVAPYALAAFGAFKGAQAAASGISTIKDKVTGAVESVSEFKDKITGGIEQAKAFGSSIKSGAQSVRLWAMYTKDGAKAAVGWVKSTAIATGAAIKNALATTGAAIKTAALAVAQTVAATGAKLWAAAQWLLNAAMSANPIGLVVIAVVALVAAFVIAWKNSETFRSIVTGAFGAVKSAAMAVVHFFTNDIPAAFKALVGGIRTGFNAVVSFLKTWGPVALSVLVPFIGIPLLIWQHFGKIKGWLAGVWTSVLGAAKGFVTDIVGAITGIPGKIAALASKMLNAGKSLMGGFFKGIAAAGSAAGGFVADLGKAIVNKIIDGINYLIGKAHLHRIHIPIPLAPDVDVPLIPNIPHLAKGGVVPATPGGRLVRVAEAGQAEAVIPLDKLGGLGGGQTINLTQNIQNPIPEAPSRTTPASIRRAAYALGN